ncbi:unnamed protein product [Phytophthora lilii]|uniref:Coatomer subunit epsilon n=1 Tax=Phytophthora lilii TaxID=2077276 RepID=A0A9W6YJ01_9STRA|nr:unnamed protein product [Phytophthora lilii]
MEPDDLFTLKNQLWVGNYQNALSEGAMLTHLGEAQRRERDVYVLRAQLALGQAAQVLQQVPEDAPAALSAVRLWATYVSGAGERELLLLTLREWLADAASGQDATLLLVAGLIYAQEGKLSDALSALTRGGGLEHLLHVTRLYLQMERPDLAQKTVADMRRLEEDSTLTQLAHAWTLTAQGGDKADEATLHFQELADRFGATPLLLNGAAAAFMALRNFAEAERLLLEALAKDPQSEDTLVNLIAASAHLNKPTHQYIAQLQQVAPSSAWLENYVLLDRGFSDMAATFA